MAEKISSVSFESVMRDMKAGKFSPVYLLMGEEAYYIDLISDFIAEHALKPEERDFNQRIVFASDVSAAQIADMARNYPVMSERQVIIVKEAQKWIAGVFKSKYCCQKIYNSWIAGGLQWHKFFINNDHVFKCMSKWIEIVVAEN